MDNGVAMLLGQIAFGTAEAYRLDTLLSVITQLRETQAFLEQRYAALRKAESDQPAQRPVAAKSAPPTARKTRGRPRANGAGPSPAPVMPLPFGGTDGESSAQAE